MLSIKKILTMAAVTLCAALPLSVSAATVADWQFNEEGIKSGSIQEGSMVMEDKSGNGNDLTMRTYGLNYKKTASFVEESFDGKSGSLYLAGYGGAGTTHTALQPTGIDFVTVDNAPINDNNFANGYTIEILYKMPEDWTVADRWTSLISRLGSTTAIDTENENVTTVVHVSNCKEIQFIPANKNNQSTLSSNVWSVAMDKAENWYHIVIKGDNTGIRVFVNGCESFRDANTTTMQGLYADPNDGRFRIGARVLAATGVPYRFTRGYIQRIRISDEALDKEDWLIPNPEEFIGEYGDNSPFAETPEDRYNFVFVPDTQNTTKFCGGVLDTAVEWIIENKDFANIEAVVSLGDNVEDFWETSQWEQITKTYTSIAQGGIRTIVPTGNHDSGNGQNFWYYRDKYFGPNTPFSSIVSDYHLEYSPSGTGGVVDISAGSFPYKLVYIDMYHIENAAEVAWLNSTLANYSNCPVIMMMHDIQNCSDTKPNETKLSTNGTILWNIVKNYDNVFLMVGGHSHGYGVLELTNNYGNKVYSILADYQFSYNGGNALMKFAEFDEKEGLIRVSTFSPYAATLDDSERGFFDVNFMTGVGNYDELEINFMERFGNFKTFKAVGENIMTNPSFEDENGNFSLEGWLSASTNAQFGSPYTTNHGYAVSATERIFNGVVTKATETIPDGKWAFATNWHDGTDGLCSLKRYVPVEAGKTYIVSYKTKHKYGADGGYIRTSLVANVGAAENADTVTSAGTVGTEWTTVERVFTATEDTDHVLFWFRWLGEGGNPGNGPYWYFDDFSIREAEEEYVSFTMNAEAVKSGETVTVTFDYNEKVENTTYLVAGFDADGNLLGVATATDGTSTITGAEIAYVKVLSWGGLTNITPLTTAKTVELE